MGFKVGSQTCKKSGLVFSRLLWAKMKKGWGGKAEGMPNIQGGEAETETGARLQGFFWTSSSSADVEVCAASWAHKPNVIVPVWMWQRPPPCSFVQPRLLPSPGETLTFWTREPLSPEISAFPSSGQMIWWSMEALVNKLLFSSSGQ